MGCMRLEKKMGREQHGELRFHILGPLVCVSPAHLSHLGDSDLDEPSDSGDNQGDIAIMTRLRIQ